METPGLIGAYVVDRNSGKFIDLTGRAEDETINNASLEIGDNGSMLSFDGANDNIDINTDKFDTDQISITTLLRSRTTSTFKRIFVSPLEYINQYAVVTGSNRILTLGNVSSNSNPLC